MKWSRNKISIFRIACFVFQVISSLAGWLKSGKDSQHEGCILGGQKMSENNKF